MPIDLDRTERRVVGCMIEKEFTVPDAYPLSLNSLVLACNQQSNREPQMHLAEHEVSGATQALVYRGWVTENDLAGGRVRRFGHRAREQLAVDDVDLAILAELLLRGPQSAQELKTRASRMRPVPSLEDAERRLEALAARPVPYVRLLGRRAGERVPRWEHLLAPAAERAANPPEGAAAASARPSTSPAVAREARPPTGTSSPAAPASPASDPLAALRERVERLERELAELRRLVGS